MKIGLLDIIYFRLRKKQMLALSKMPHSELEPQSRFNNERFVFSFYDKDGLAYYHVKDDTKMPMVRKLYAANAFIKFHNAISDLDVSTSLEGIKAALYEKNQKGNMQPNIARIGYICEKLLARKGDMIRRDLLTELAASYFIREDEAIEVVNHDIFNQKVQAITVEGELLSDVFFSKSLDELFPYLTNMEGVLKEMMDLYNTEVLAYLKELNSYIDGRRGTIKV